MSVKTRLTPSARGRSRSIAPRSRGSSRDPLALQVAFLTGLNAGYVSKSTSAEGYKDLVVLYYRLSHVLGLRGITPRDYAAENKDHVTRVMRNLGLKV